MNNKPSHQDQEIDLGQLFQLIGNGFNKLFQFVSSIFNGCLNILLHILLFFKRNILKIVITGAVGGILGLGFDLSKEPQYEATMVVKPNFQSGRQLYKNIAYYDELVSQKEFERLANIFSISENDAAQLVKFEIEPVIMENYLVSSYDEFLKSIDSNLAQTISYEKYKENFPEFSFSQHEIRVVSKQNNVFRKLEPTILKNVVANDYFKKLEQAEKEIIERNKAYLATSIEEVDTLRRVYKEVLLAEAKKETTQGTSINMGGQQESNKELKLFAEEQRINHEMDKLIRVQVEKSEILNVVSDFQEIGFEVNSPMNRFVVIVPIIVLTLLLTFLVGMEFWGKLK